MTVISETMAERQQGGLSESKASLRGHIALTSVNTTALFQLSLLIQSDSVNTLVVLDSLFLNEGIVDRFC